MISDFSPGFDAGFGADLNENAPANAPLDAALPAPDTAAPTPADPPVIDLHSDDWMMGEALRQARRAYAADEVPIGAVVTHKGRVIARAFNQVEQLRDATAHAEMLAITQAENALGDWRLNECELYVTKEPCPMCAGAIVHARLRRVVFGCPDPKGGGAGGLFNIVQHPSLNHRCEVTQGVRLEECRGMLRTFFGGKRRKAGTGE